MKSFVGQRLSVHLPCWTLASRCRTCRLISRHSMWISQPFPCTRGVVLPVCASDRKETMDSARPRILITVGIVIAAFNLRPGVPGLSPLLDAMGEEIHLSATFLAIIGMLPPLLYGLSGFITPRLYTRFTDL